MTDPKTLPKIGDRVQFGDRVYVVVQVDEETETASIIPEGEIVTKPLSEIIRSSDGEGGRGTRDQGGGSSQEADHAG